MHFIETIPNFRKWLIIKCAINVAKGVLPSSTYFEGERLLDDYIKLCKLGTYMVIQKRF
jgi:hypothetical protein